MVVGNGQLAKIFKEYSDNEHVCIFASGVSNSTCIDENEFEREKQLILKTLVKNYNMKFVYFSSCALSSDNYVKNRYYLHKLEMQNLIKKYSNVYYIFRLPQLFGNLFSHKTLINFLYDSIINDKEFIIFDEAYRYVIDIDDVKNLVDIYLAYGQVNMTLDLANDYQYKVLEIVEILEELLGKKAFYSLINKEDKYDLDLTKLKEFIDKYSLNIVFNKDYLFNKLENRLFDLATLV